jgi:hypothetical protein
MPQLLGEGNCNYTPLSTVGTYTLNQQPANQQQAAYPGVLFGFTVVTLGTGYAATFLDVYVNGTTTVTNTLLNGTGTAGQNFPAGVPGIGVRYKGSLLAVTTGTAGLINALWD